jgi:hypothetical protein
MSSNFEDILDEFEKVIKQSESFKDAKVYYRPEAEKDEQGFSIYLVPASVRADESNFFLDFRINAVSISIRFHMESPSYHDHQKERDVMLRKVEVADEFLALLKVYNTGDSVSNVYLAKVDGSVNFNPPVVGEARNFHRIAMTWEFLTVQHFEA